MYTLLVTQTVETYVTIHDQDLILECIASDQFKDLDPTYLFVGKRPVDRVPPEVKLIVCRDYSPNYERFPHFYDFTGWYVLAKHNLITADYTIMLQYDHHVTDTGLAEDCANRLSTNPGMVCFVPTAYDPNNWFLMVDRFKDNFIRAARAAGVDLLALMDANPFTWWPTTQGTAWRTEYLTQFMMWFEPVFEELQTELFAGHIAERLLKVYTMCNNEAQPTHGLVAHFSKDIHGTSDYMRGNMASFNDKNNRFLA